MSDSRTESILQAIVAALDAAGKPAGTSVNRSRRRKVEVAELPMISVYPVHEEIHKAGDARRSGLKDRNFTVQVRCRAEGTDEALDPLRQWVVTALEFSPSLGGLAIDTAESSADWDAAEGTDADFSVCDMNFTVRYTTARADLTKAA